MPGVDLGRVLFVCVGNVCRSPMAAAVLKKRAANLVVESAGLAALVGEPAEPHAVALMRAAGIDLSRHRARQLTPQMASGFDLILVMDEEQRREVERLFPAGRGRVHRLGRFGGFDVPDPYQQPRAAFEQSLALIERGIGQFERAFWKAP